MTRNLQETDTFKTHIQKILEQNLGITVSKDKAWNVFKLLIKSTIHYVVQIPPDAKGNSTLSIAGLFKIQIQRKQPKGVKAGYPPIMDASGRRVAGYKSERDPNLPVWAFVPRLKVTMSTAIQRAVETFFNLPTKEREEFASAGIFLEDTSEVTVDAQAPSQN